MGNVTRFGGGVGIGRPGDSPATLASSVHVLPASFDPTSASQVELGQLPKGAKVIDVVGLGGATGGTNPTVDIGTSGDDDGFANELDCDAGASSAVAAGTTGALLGTQLTVPTIVYGKVGASAATGGTAVVHIHFIVEDV
jgi:hypothetical protein